MPMDEEYQSQEPDVMDHKRFLDHPTRVHLMRQRLTDIFDAKQHWVFAMTGECTEIAVRIATLHAKRCGTHIDMLPVCCLQHTPVFFMFPKESLAFYEIESLLEVQVAGSKAEAEQMHYFTLAMQDPKPLSEALQVWIHHDHLMN
jgi:hypothetical protein